MTNLQPRPSPTDEFGPFGGPLEDNYAVTGGLVTQSKPTRALLGRITRVAAADVPVLIRGEVGTEFEQVAHAIHLNSPRSHGPLVGESCAVLRDPYLVRHLFGHLRGAFTGAGSSADGLLAIADSGTLYFDEVADLAPEAQACLIRVLETGHYRPLGSANARHTDIRVVSSTAADLEAMVREGQFRGDLYYRLRGALIDIPPLRERREDALAIALQELARRPLAIGVADAGLPDDVRAAIMAHDWPGNTRELRQEIQQAVAIAGGEPLSADLFQFHNEPAPRVPRRPSRPNSGLRTRIDEFEARAVREALMEAGGNKAEAARKLGVTRRTLYRRLAQMRGEPDS